MRMEFLIGLHGVRSKLVNNLKTHLGSITQNKGRLSLYLKMLITVYYNKKAFHKRNAFLLCVLYHWFATDHKMYATPAHCLRLYVSTSILLATIPITFQQQLPLHMIVTVSETVQGRLWHRVWCRKYC